jgi:RHS repeat-associated protein
MPQRSTSSGSYRYGFNGHEKDDEVKGSGNHISFNDYGYDPRLGRRFGVDPAFNAMLSPYAVYNNNPNFYIDPDGESPISILIKAAAKKGLVKAAKELVESQIQKKLSQYMSKGWAKQLLSDAVCLCSPLSRQCVVLSPAFRSSLSPLFEMFSSCSPSSPKAVRHL